MDDPMRSFSLEMEAEESSPTAELVEELVEARPKSRRSYCEEEDVKERTMVADQIEEAEQFNLTIEYVDEKPTDVDSDDPSSLSSKHSGFGMDTEECDENIELESSETTTSPASLSVSAVKKPTDRRRSIAMELLTDWTPSPGSADRKRRSNVIEEDVSTPKRKMITREK